MASQVPPLKNTAYTFYAYVVSQADTKIFKASATLAAGDVKVAIDTAAPANLATLPVVDADFTKRIQVDLSAAEMNGDVISILFSDAAGAEWCDASYDIHTSSALNDTIAGRLPTTLVSGRIDASVGAMAANVVTAAAVADGAIDAATFAAGAITAAAIAADAIGASELAADAVTEIQAAVAAGSVASVVGAVGSVTGNVGGNVTGSVGSVATGGIATTSFAAGAINAAAIATDAITAAKIAADAIGASELAADAVTEIVTGILAGVIEGTITVQQAHRLYLAVLAGKSTGGGTATVNFRNNADTLNRVQATVDGSGNRSAVTLDVT